MEDSMMPDLYGMTSTQLKHHILDTADVLAQLGIWTNLTVDSTGMKGTFTVKPSPFDLIPTPAEVGH